MARRSSTQPAAREIEIPLDRITVGELHMRSAMDHAQLAELAESLSHVGLINAVTVRETEHGYELIAGHRRCAAAEALGWSTIRGRVVTMDPLAAARAAWSENAARADVTIIDQARWIRRQLEATGASQSTMAQLLGMSQSHLSEVLSTLDYPDILREALEAGAISAGVARELSRIAEPTTLDYFTTQAAENGCTVRAASEWVRNWKLSQLNTMPNGGDGAPIDDTGATSYALSFLCAICRETHAGIATTMPMCPNCAQAIQAAAVAQPSAS